MAELTISSDEVRSAIEDYVSSYSRGLDPSGGRHRHLDAVTASRYVEGLPSTMTNELLEFPGGVLGLALNLDVREIGVVILGDYETIEEGQQVTRTGEVLSVPVGDGFLGRVVNPLGKPIDGLGEIESEESRALELQAASVVQRQGVKRAAADRDQGDRRHDPDRPRPAPADHR